MGGAFLFEELLEAADVRLRGRERLALLDCAR